MTKKPPGRYAQLFLDCYGNIPPVVRQLASGLDEHEARLETCRIALGFLDNWSPAYDRRQRSGVNAPVKWAEKAGTINGMGDLNSFIGELAAGMDVLNSKLVEIEEEIATRPAPAVPEKRGPGRPRKIA